MENQVRETTVPDQVFIKFLEELKHLQINQEIISKLEKALIKDKTISEAVIKNAFIINQTHD